MSESGAMSGSVWTTSVLRGVCVFCDREIQPCSPRIEERVMLTVHNELGNQAWRTVRRSHHLHCHYFGVQRDLRRIDFRPLTQAETDYGLKLIRELGLTPKEDEAPF